MSHTQPHGQNFIIPFTFDNMAIRGKFLRFTNLKEACPSLAINNKTTDTLLNMLLTCAITVQDFKTGSSMTLQIQNAESGALFVANCNEQGHLKAYANETAQQSTFESHSEQGATFAATVYRNEQVYQSFIPMEYKTITKAIEAYFTHSVQADTQLRVWTHEEGENLTCSALFLQTLPEDEDKKTPDDWQRTAMLLDTVKQEEANTLMPAELLYRLFHEDDTRLFEAMPLDFKQDNPRDRMATALISLGEATCREMLQEGDITMQDAYTGTEETFTEEDITTLFAHKH